MTQAQMSAVTCIAGALTCMFLGNKQSKNATQGKHMSKQLGTERAKACLECAQQRQKAYFDKGHHDVTYKVGLLLEISTLIRLSHSHM